VIDEIFRVHGMGWCGSQTCPFNNLSDKDIKSGSYDFTVENIKTNDIIKFSSLIAHLIRDHHFCEGDTPQRLDPEYGIKVHGELIQMISHIKNKLVQSHFILMTLMVIT